jgi:hypothetical protein
VVEGSTNLQDREVLIQFRKYILNFVEYNNPIIFIFFIFFLRWALPFLEHKKKITQLRKYKCSVLEVHIPHKSARNIIKSSKEKYKSMRARSTYIHNGKGICSLSEVQKSSIICKTNNDIIRENERKYNNDK